MNNKVISLKREIKDDYNYRELLRPCVPISSSAEATSAPLCLPAHFQMKEKVMLPFL